METRRLASSEGLNSSLAQCFSAPSPRTHLSPRKALGESASTRGKQVFCNALTQ